MASGRGMLSDEDYASMLERGAGVTLGAIKEEQYLYDYGTLSDESPRSLVQMSSDEEAPNISDEGILGTGGGFLSDEEAALGAIADISDETRTPSQYESPKFYGTGHWVPPDSEHRIHEGASSVVRALQAQLDEEEEDYTYEDVDEDARNIIDNIDDMPLPENYQTLYEHIGQGIGAGIQAVHDAYEGLPDSTYREAPEAPPGRVSAQAIAASYEVILNSIHQVQEKMPEGEYNAFIGPLLEHEYGEGRGGDDEGGVGGEDAEGLAAAAAVAERDLWRKDLAGREVHDLWTEADRKEYFLQSLREDAGFLMERQSELSHANATPNDELDLQDIQMTFVKHTIRNGRRRYLLPLAFQIKNEAAHRANENDPTNYKPLIQVLVMGYFFPEFYRDYDSRERQRELITFKRKYLGSLDILTKAAMDADPSLKKSDAVQEKWREAMGTAVNLQAMEEIEDDIREQALFAADEALAEQRRWGPDWLEEIDVLVDTTIYNAKLPNVRGKRFSLVPQATQKIGGIVLNLVEETMDGRIEIEEASAAIHAVLRVIPEVFEANPNPEVAAAPIAAALQAALAVVQEGPVSAALQQGDIASALAAVKNLEAIQNIPAEKVALTLQSVLGEVHAGPYGRQQVKARAALRSITAALASAATPDRADQQVADQVLQVVASVAANAAAQGAANAVASIHLEGAETQREDVEAAVEGAARAAASGAVAAVGEAACQAALQIIAGANAPTSPGVQPLDMANAVAEAANDAGPQAAANAQHMAEQAVQQVVHHANAAAQVGFHVVNVNDLKQLPAEEQEALHKTAAKLVQLGRLSRPDTIVQAVLKETGANFGLMYMEKLYKTIMEILSREEKFLPGVGSLLVSIHRYMMLRRRKRLPKRTFENFEDIPLQEGRIEVDKMITAIIVATQRGAKGEPIVDRIIDEAYHAGGILYIEHLYMGLAWDQKQKTIIPKIYDTMRKIHDFIIMVQ